MQFLILAANQSKSEIRTGTPHECLLRRTGRKGCAEQLTPDHVSLLNFLHLCIVFFLSGAHGLVAKLQEPTNQQTPANSYYSLISDVAV